MTALGDRIPDPRQEAGHDVVRHADAGLHLQREHGFEVPGRQPIGPASEYRVLDTVTPSPLDVVAHGNEPARVRRHRSK